MSASPSTIEQKRAPEIMVPEVALFALPRYTLVKCRASIVLGAHLSRVKRGAAFMRIVILHNRDHELIPDDPGKEAREDIERVATAMAQALSARGRTIDLVPVDEPLLLLLRRVEALSEPAELDRWFDAALEAKSLEAFERSITTES